MANPAASFMLGLGNIPLLDASETRPICAENPTGARVASPRGRWTHMSAANRIGHGGADAV